MRKGLKKSSVSGSAKKSKSVALRSITKLKTAPKVNKTHGSVKAAFGPTQLFLIVLAFAFAGLGQWFWMRLEEDHTKLPGAIFFILGCALFIKVLWPWRKQEEGLDAISRPVETSVFILIMALAAFFRIYRLGDLPPGIFFDQGYMGWLAERIMHEGYHPFFPDEFTHNSPMLAYQLVPWLAIFKLSQFNYLLFFSIMSLVSLGFIYWAFRQLAGPRQALVAFFILAVMRWDVTFSRNGFPSVEVPFYMFGTIAPLLYGLKTGKRWAFILAGLLFGMGLYTYQAYKIFPALLVLFGVYEFWTNRETMRKNWKNLAVFSLVFFMTVSPIVGQAIASKAIGWRESNYNIFSQIREAHSLKPLIEMVEKTAWMYNRTGDSNERHNIPNHRMLDNITGVLFVMGLFFALFHVRQRKYFFAVIGFLVMLLPCLLSQDPAHANRLLGSVPFLALLASFPVMALWGRVRAKWGSVGEFFLILILLQPAFLMGLENYKTFFEEFAACNSLYSTGVFAGYSVPETRVGEMVLKDGENEDYYIDPRFYDFPTVNFLTYPHKDRVKKFEMPGDFAPFKTDDPKRGLCYVIMHEHTGVLRILKGLYPTGTLEESHDLNGSVMVEFFKVPPEAAAQAHGLKGNWGKGDQVLSAFPQGLPSGPFHGVFKGDLFVKMDGDYHFTAQSNGKVTWSIAGHPILPSTHLFLPRGFYSIEVHLAAPEGPVQLNLALAGPKITVPLGNDNLTPLNLHRGVLGHWFSSQEPGGPIVFEQWSPVLNFPHGGDFNYTNWAFSIIWEGTLNTPEVGDYSFEGKTDEPSRLEIDGKQVYDWGANRVGTIHLLKGKHKMKLLYRKVLGPIFNLYWKTPSDAEFTDIPLEAYGETGPMALTSNQAVPGPATVVH
jgi:hypothetical protein